MFGLLLAFCWCKQAGYLVSFSTWSVRASSVALVWRLETAA